MDLKIFFVLIIVVLTIAGVYYISNLQGRHSSACPPGSRFVRRVTSGWADTDPTDPWGQCISQEIINISYGQ
jgi:hypothetical protein